MKKNTCEIKYYKYMFTLFLIFNSIIILPIFIIPKAFKDDGYISLLFVLAIIFLPLLFYYGYKLRYYIKIKPLYIQEVKLEKVESSWNRLASFSILMEINGHKKKINTLAIFNVGFIGPNFIDDYSSKKALVGYDEKYDVALVIKVLD